jgi:hypothetical protein
MPPWLSALQSILGVVVGAAITYLLSRTQEAAKHRQSLKTAAYVDYLRGVAQTAQAQQRGSRDGVIEGNALMADAKARICVYGDAHAIRALAEFSKLGARLESREEVGAFLALCQAMRDRPNDVISKDDLSQVLMGASVEALPPCALIEGDKSG